MSKRKKSANPKEEVDSEVAPKDKMSEEQLLQIVDSELSNALGKMDTRLSNSRLMAMKYYNGEKEGRLAPPESEGRSTVVSMDVSDTIEWILPSLLRIFTSGDDAVVYSPKKLEDEESAKQMTDWGNYVFYTQNPGFVILHNWFKDALLQKTGIIKTWWNDAKDITTESYEGLTLDELALMMQDKTVEVIQKTERPDDNQKPPAPGQPPMPPAVLYDVKIKRTRNSAHTCIENVPPEEFLFNRKARSADRIFSCHHRLLRTVTELKESGYENTDSLMNDDAGAEFSQEAVERERDTSEFVYGSQFMQPADESMRFVWITESYLQVDWNGDGLAEWRKIVKSGKVLLSNEETDEHPFSIITPIMMPHKLVGKSIADMVMDLQEIKTALMRQLIDNMYLQNNPRMYVDESQGVNIDDLLDSRVGGIVRGKGPNGVSPLINAPLSPMTFNMLEYIDTVKENRTGITKYNQGLDANSLNKTATGINAIMNAAQQRIELIARVFAETGVKDMFGKVLKLSAKYQQEPQMVRLRNKFIPIDPRAWKTQYDISINVGLGTGNKDQMAQHVMGIINIQKEAMAAGLPIVTPKNIYNAAAKFTINSGFSAPEEFFTDPDAQQQQPQQPKPDPEAAKMQADMQMGQMKLQSTQQIEQGKLQLQQQRAQVEMQLKERVEMEKIASNERMKMAELQANPPAEAQKTRLVISKDDGAESMLPQVASVLENLAMVVAKMASDNNSTNEALIHSMSMMAAASSAPKVGKLSKDAHGNTIAEIRPA